MEASRDTTAWVDHHHSMDKGCGAVGDLACGDEANHPFQAEEVLDVAVARGREVPTKVHSTGTRETTTRMTGQTTRAMKMSPRIMEMMASVASFHPVGEVDLREAEEVQDLVVLEVEGRKVLEDLLVTEGEVKASWELGPLGAVVVVVAFP